MKLTATITAEVNLKEDDDFTEAKERALSLLFNTVHEWVEGECAPQIKFSFEHEADGAEYLNAIN